MKMFDDFKQRLKNVYVNNLYWIKVFSVITSKNVASRSSTVASENVANSTSTMTSKDVVSSTLSATNNRATQTSHSLISQLFRDDTIKTTTSLINQSLRDIRFRLRDDFIYYVSDDNDSKNRLCISASIKKKVFRIAHNLNSYEDFYRIYDRFVNLMFVKHLTKRFRVYIEHCLKCQFHQTKRHSLYELLQSINTLTIFFHTVIIDFILALLLIDEYDCVMTVTCKFIKKFMTIFDKSIWDTKNWVNVFIIALMTRDWGISRNIIGDRDRKFVSFFWRIIFFRFNVALLIFIAYYLQIDEQSKKTNQTLEIAFRFWLSDSENINWFETFSYFTTANNNVVNATIDFALNELLYEFHVNDTLTMLENLSAKNYSRFRQIKREFAEKAMTFVNIMRKLRYDAKHIDFELIVGGYVYLCFYNDYTISDLINRKLNQQRVGFFKILKKIGTLIYRLELSFVMKIYSIIFITQLKSSSALNADSYRRSRSNQKNSPLMQVKNDSEPKNPVKFYEVESLLDKRILFIDRVTYLIKWKDYGFQNNVWYFFYALKNSMNLVQKYDVEHEQSATNSRRRRSAVKNRDRSTCRQITASAISVSSSLSSSFSMSSSLFVDVEFTRRSTRLLLKFATTISENRRLENESS